MTTEMLLPIILSIGWLVLAGALSVVSMWGLGVWAALRGGAS